MSVPNWVRAVIESDEPWETVQLTQTEFERVAEMPFYDACMRANDPWVFQGYVYHFRLSDALGQVHRKKLKKGPG